MKYLIALLTVFSTFYAASKPSDNYLTKMEEFRDLTERSFFLSVTCNEEKNDIICKIGKDKRPLYKNYVDKYESDFKLSLLAADLYEKELRKDYGFKGRVLFIKEGNDGAKK